MSKPMERKQYKCYQCGTAMENTNNGCVCRSCGRFVKMNDRKKGVRFT